MGDLTFDADMTDRDRWIALSAVLEGIHATMFGYASMGHADSALEAISDYGTLHEQVHVALRILPSKEEIVERAAERGGR